MTQTKRLLVYGMQSSGASTFCYFLGQRPGSIAIIDVWSRAVAPLIETACPVVAKATVTATRYATDHIASFRPERSILFVRDPVAVYASLIKYPYANRFGRIEDKMRLLEREFVSGQWDAVIRYEDFVTRDPAVVTQINALGWDCAAYYWEMPRSLVQIRDFNVSASSWCARHFEDGWGFGNIKPGAIRPTFAVRPDRPELADLVASLSPRLFAAYEVST